MNNTAAEDETTELSVSTTFEDDDDAWDVVSAMDVVDVLLSTADDMEGSARMDSGLANRMALRMVE